MENKIINEAYADLIIDLGSSYALEYPDSVTELNQWLAMIHIPIQEINKCSLGVFPYRMFPKCYTLESIINLEKTGVTMIQNNPNLALYGSGVLIGIIDTGIDYQHQAFIQNGNTKILSIWDQTIEDENRLTENIQYGAEYDREMINEALRSPNPLEIVPSVDEIGHGTMTAGIIAGNENAQNEFRGIVPQAELIVVKLKQAKNITREIFAIPKDAVCYQETDIILAANYLYSQARRLDRPMAICLALGSNQGSHDGRGTLAEYLSFINDNRGMSVSISAGNMGSARRHYLGVIEGPAYNNDFELNVGENEYGFSMELWQSTPYRLSIDIRSPAGEYISPILPTIRDCRRISFIFETTNIYVNNIISESQSGEQLILVRFEYPTKGIWRFRVTNLDELASSFNIWLPNGELVSTDTYLLNSNPDTTITSPGDSQYPMTITAYNSGDDSIWINSSRGYTRTNAIKPDMAAPGVNITCPTINNGYGSTTGSGAAAAHAAGAAAMLWEWGIVKGNYPNLYGPEVKQILIRGAKRENQLIYPNKIWGYGILDIYEAFNKLS